MADARLSKVHKEALCNIRKAQECSAEQNKQFFEYMSYAYQSSLSKDDKESLKAEDKPTFEVSILNPIIYRQLKNISDSNPSVVVKSDKFSPQAEAISEKVKSVLNSSYMDVQSYNVGKQALCGGFGVFEVVVDYKNNSGFDQEICVKAVDNPTSIYFDPSCRERTKCDSSYIIRLCEMDEDEFSRVYPKANIEKIIEFQENRDDKTCIDWITGDKDNKKVMVAEYFYYKYEDRTIGLLPNGETVDVDEDYDIDMFVDIREVKEKTVCKIAICGNKLLLKPEESSFKMMPFIYVPGDSYINENGKQCVRPYIKSALDAQRLKNFTANFFLFDMVNRNEGTWLIGKSSMTETAKQELKYATTKRKMIEYIDHGIDPESGQPIQGQPPQYVQPEPLNTEMLNAMAALNSEIEHIVGSQYQSLDDKGMSGAALRNLSDFISASNEPFMQSLLEGIEKVGKVIVSTLPEIMISNELVSIGSGESAKQVELEPGFNFDDFDLYIDRSPSTNLMRQASVENLIKIAQMSQPFAQWLSTGGLKYVLDNLDLDNKSEIETQFMNEVQKQQQAMQNQQPPQNPADMIKAQASMVNAQANMSKANNQGVDNKIKVLNLAQKRNESDKDLMTEMARINVQHMDSQAQATNEHLNREAENQRTLLHLLSGQ